MRPPRLLPFTWPRSPRLAERAVLGASLVLLATGGCSLILGIEDVTERKNTGGSGGASSSNGVGGHGQGASSSSTESTSSTGGPPCDPATRWPVMSADKIVPPNHMMGLDLRGADDGGITIDEAVAVNCIGVDAGGGGVVGGGGMSWGDAGQATLIYDVAIGRWEQLYLTAGYTGTMTWKSLDKQHTYVAQVGGPITRDGKTFVIDWFPIGDAGSTQALLDAEITELYNGIVATFEPGTPQAVNCNTEDTCAIYPDDGSSAHNAVFVVRGAVHMGFQMPNPQTLHQTSTLNLIYEFAQSTWGDFTQNQQWTTFDTTKVDADSKGFIGAEYDGRYLYLVPNGPTSKVTRFDTTASLSFSSAGPAWTTFDTVANVDANAKGFSGGTYNGQTLFLAPNTNGLVVSYDTTTAFEIPTNWSKFDTTTLTPPATSFAGAVYSAYGILMLVPSTNGVVAGFNAGGVFTDATQWQTFDLTTIDTRLQKFHGGVSAGSYIYLAPHGAGPDYPGIIARWNVSSYDVADATQWETFDLSLVDSGMGSLLAFDGGVYDGSQYLYFLPAANGTSDGGDVMRYDTTQPFAQAASWQHYTLYPGNFTTGGWDARYVYLSGPTSTISRYDSQAPFGPDTSWNSFDVSQINPSAVAFQGTAFDGRYMYFVPDTGSTLVRLDSKFPAIGVSALSASFY
jgi:hypothetical protein